MNIIRQGKKLFGGNQRAIAFALWCYNHLPFNNKRIIKGKNNRFDIHTSMLKNCRIRIKGDNNQIVLGARCTLRSCSIYISGSNNTLCLGDKVAMIAGEIHMEENSNEITVGAHTSFLGKTHLACIEGTKISIGEDCLFSSEVTLRTGDSHAITDLKGKRINPSEDIALAGHVWVGNRTILTKGVSISEHSVVATGAIVTGNFPEPNVIIGGVPAKVIKTGVSWDINRKIK